MNAKQYLQQVIRINTIIQNKLIEKEQWMAMATSTTITATPDKVQSSSSNQKMADAVIRMVEMEAEIDAYIDKLVDIKQDVIKTIEKLPVTEYDLLHKVYIQLNELDEAAAMMDKSYSWATTVHGRALKHLQDLLDERNDTNDKSGDDCG